MAYTTRVSILNGLNSNENDAAWEEFYNQYQKLALHIGLTKYNLPEETAKDIWQAVVCKFFLKKIVTKYRPECGKFRTYIGFIIENAIKDYLVQQKHLECTGISEDVAFSAADSEALAEPEQWESPLKERQYLIMKLAMQRLRETSDVKRYMIFQQRKIEDRDIDLIARQFDETPKNIYQITERMEKKLAKTVKEIEKDFEG